MFGHLTPAVVNVYSGKLAAFARMPCVERVPDGLSVEEASLAGPATVACRGIDAAAIPILGHLFMQKHGMAKSNSLERYRPTRRMHRWLSRPGSTRQYV